MLTPIEIQSKTFKVGIGFDKRDVEAFFKEVLAAYEQLYKENVELNDKIGVLSEGIQYYKSIEKTLQKALVLAEKTSDDTKKAAVNEATHIEKEAKAKAKMIIADAQHELDSIHMKTISLVQQYNKYKAQFRQLAATQMELLDGESFHIDLSGYETFKQKEDEDTASESKNNNSSSNTSASENVTTEDTNAIKVSKPEIPLSNETQNNYGYSAVTAELSFTAAQTSSPVLQNESSNRNTYSAGVQQASQFQSQKNDQQGDSLSSSYQQQTSPYQNNTMTNESIPAATYSNQYYNGSLPEQKQEGPFLDEFESPYISSSLNVDSSSKKKEKRENENNESMGNKLLKGFQKKSSVQNGSPSFTDSVPVSKEVQDNTNSVPPQSEQTVPSPAAVSGMPDIPVKENDHVDILIKELRAASKETPSTKGIMDAFSNKKNETNDDDGFNFISYDD